MDLSISAAVSWGLVSLFVLAALSIVWMSWRNGISPMPASALVRRAVTAEINRSSGGGLILEAGSGWGTLGIHLAKYCQPRQVRGVENSPIPLAVSRMMAWLTFGARKPAARAVFVKGDIYQISYREAEAVVCYLFPGAMRRLAPIFREQLGAEARVISVCFALPGWEPERIITCGDLYRTRIYVYGNKNRQPSD
ncbi:class I SAM-dependent methyltransferase [Cohnella boryungensis]|uniref:Class I SAM-dependent methyltransferase n=1 Tax=Cohnella boryungensis TaxID=768479 RepID=A0ABV8S8L5_9BACL